MCKRDEYMCTKDLHLYEKRLFNTESLILTAASTQNHMILTSAFQHNVVLKWPVYVINCEISLHTDAGYCVVKVHICVVRDFLTQYCVDQQCVKVTNMCVKESFVRVQRDLGPKGDIYGTYVSISHFYYI